MWFVIFSKENTDFVRLSSSRRLLQMPIGLIFFWAYTPHQHWVQTGAAAENKVPSPPNLDTTHSPSLAILNFDVWYGHLREIFIHSKWLFKKWRANTKLVLKQHWVSACRDKMGLSNYGWTSCQEIFLSTLSPATSSQWLMVIIISWMEFAVYWLELTWFLVIEVLRIPYYLVVANVRNVRYLSIETPSSPFINNASNHKLTSKGFKIDTAYITTAATVATTTINPMG